MIDLVRQNVICSPSQPIFFGRTHGDDNLDTRQKANGSPQRRRCLRRRPKQQPPPSHRRRQSRRRRRRIKPQRDGVVGGTPGGRADHREVGPQNCEEKKSCGGENEKFEETGGRRGGGERTRPIGIVSSDGGNRRERRRGVDVGDDDVAVKQRRRLEKPQGTVKRSASLVSGSPFSISCPAPPAPSTHTCSFFAILSISQRGRTSCLAPHEIRVDLLPATHTRTRTWTYTYIVQYFPRLYYLGKSLQFAPTPHSMPVG